MSTQNRKKEKQKKRKNTAERNKFRIVQMEIENFKSFSRKTTIPFYDGHTVLSGPDWPSRNSIVDAIHFALLLPPLEDTNVYFNKESGKDAADVSLTFSDGTHLRRTIRQTATSLYSHYYLNHTVSSPAKISAYLAKRGIHPCGYNIVTFDGFYQRILVMSDRERRWIIDGIAGIPLFNMKMHQGCGWYEIIVAKNEHDKMLTRTERLKRKHCKAFMKAYDTVNANFQSIYHELTGGEGHLILDNYENPFEGGLSLEASPKGKPLQRLNMMTAAKKIPATLAFVFAVQKSCPAPFYVFDEVDAAPNNAVEERLSLMVHAISKQSQFIIDSNRRTMIEKANRMVKVTVEPNDGKNIVTDFNWHPGWKKGCVCGGNQMLADTFYNWIALSETRKLSRWMNKNRHKQLNFKTRRGRRMT